MWFQFSAVNLHCPCNAQLFTAANPLHPLLCPCHPHCAGLLANAPHLMESLRPTWSIHGMHLI
jgi:hypothetical protein